ncbi:PIN domain-containing protein [Candidatus Saccharibacteria bacterium]|nr:PIN domain-containing protein [Candidatus Saccharibacteria bacterium]
MRVLIDTCVIVDAIRDRKPFSDSAQQILLMAERGYLEGFISANQLTDLHYLIRRETHSSSLAEDILKQLTKTIKIIDTTSDDCRRALVSGRNDFEDALEIESAIREDMDYIITRNTKDYADSPVQVYTPEQFVREMAIGN